jgi:hypothetical protein
VSGSDAGKTAEHGAVCCFDRDIVFILLPRRVLMQRCVIVCLPAYMRLPPLPSSSHRSPNKLGNSRKK